jgi:3-hydroxyacyl-CoA dehydrogenase
LGKLARRVRPKISSEHNMIHADNAEVTQSSDSPGFIANAILMPMLNEAILVLEKV